MLAKFNSMIFVHLCRFNFGFKFAKKFEYEKKKKRLKRGDWGDFKMLKICSLFKIARSFSS
jgi:hypothetical protein